MPICFSSLCQVTNTIVRNINYSVILFFSPSHNASVSAFKYGPRLSRSFQVSTQAEIYNPITVTGSHCIFLLFFKWAMNTYFSSVNAPTVSFPVKGLVLPSLICAVWQLFGPNLICGCWFWSQAYWKWFESITAPLESIMNLLHLYGILLWQALCSLMSCRQSYPEEVSKLSLSLFSFFSSFIVFIIFAEDLSHLLSLSFQVLSPSSLTMSH